MSTPSPADPPPRDEVRALFLAQGFCDVGFTSAEPVADGVTPWVAAGRHAGMDYMARDPAARADPRALLPDAQSVICVAAGYPATDGRGAIAGYARGEDYHRTLTAALERAVAALAERVPGLTARVCVDATPLLERSLAARAGLGWIGKNTMLLDERRGPWVLLGEVITNLALPADAPATDRCGTCTACIEACPTGALDAPGQLDARRCLSYWTIEHRGALPDTWAAALGTHLFGCDDCLAACPFPARSPAAAAPNAGGPPVWQLRPDLVDPDLDDLERRAHESFKRHFGSTPLERARKGGLLRNLAAVRTASAPDRPGPTPAETRSPPTQ